MLCLGAARDAESREASISEERDVSEVDERAGEGKDRGGEEGETATRQDLQREDVGAADQGRGRMKEETKGEMSRVMKIERVGAAKESETLGES